MYECIAHDLMYDIFSHVCPDLYVWFLPSLSVWVIDGCPSVVCSFFLIKRLSSSLSLLLLFLLHVRYSLVTPQIFGTCMTSLCCKCSKIRTKTLSVPIHLPMMFVEFLCCGSCRVCTYAMKIFRSLSWQGHQKAVITVSHISIVNIGRS